MDPTYLIVNADDYGYFNCVSRGILEAIAVGGVTATGIMANSPHVQDRVLSLLRVGTDVDVGIHLNLTLGSPLTDAMKRRLNSWNQQFRGKLALVAALVRGTIRLQDVRSEWRAQIERCLKLGVQPRFLNSHEHIHMLPPLYSVVREVAGIYQIAYVRHVTPERASAILPQSAVRNIVMTVLSHVNARRATPAAPRLLGLAVSGRLNLEYLARRLSSLRSGRIYELMCHPGFYDPQEIKEPGLVAYHEWESELRSLTSPSFRSLCTQYNIKLIGFRDLTLRNSQLAVR